MFCMILLIIKKIHLNRHKQNMMIHRNIKHNNQEHKYQVLMAHVIVNSTLTKINLIIQILRYIESNGEERYLLI